jgi:hypothetical protein
MQSTSASTRTRSSRRNQSGATSASRAKKLQRYQQLVAGVLAHQSDPGFPNLFADGSVVAQLQQGIQGAVTLDATRVAAQGSTQKEEAMRSQGDALLFRGESALVSFYGPTSQTLVDFGVKPKRTVPRRHKLAASGAASTGGSATGGGSASSSMAASPAPFGASSSGGPSAGGGSPSAGGGNTTAASAPAGNVGTTASGTSAAGASQPSAVASSPAPTPQG